MKKLFFASLIVLTAINANAALVSYEFSGFANGWIWNSGLSTVSSTFSGIGFSITLQANTSDIQPIDATALDVPGDASIYLEGYGRQDILINTRIFISHIDGQDYSVLGFSRESGGDLLNIYDAALKNYDLSTSFDPLTPSSTLVTQWGNSPRVRTAIGDIFLNSASGVVFSATTVPIPSSIVLFEGGLLSVSSLARRKRIRRSSRETRNSFFPA